MRTVVNFPQMIVLISSTYPAAPISYLFKFNRFVIINQTSMHRIDEMRDQITLMAIH